jgi:serine protease Do
MNHRRYVPFNSALILILAFSLSARSVRAQSESDAAFALESALVKVIAEAEESVVSIARIRVDPDTDVPPRLNPFGFRGRLERQRQQRNNPDSPDYQPNEFGAGVILARRNEPNSRYILTNYHVVAGGPISSSPLADHEAELYVKLTDGHAYFATIRAADPRSDLAVLDINFDRLQLKPTDLKPLRLPAPETTLRKGQIVIGLGNPYAIARDGSPSASWGIISNLRRHPKPPPEPESIISEPEESLHHTGTLLQVDMKINIGTSGGALVSLKGEFVGLTTSLAAIEGFDTAAGFAVPVDEQFLRIFETLSRGQEVEYGFLGVRPEDVSPRDVSQLDMPIPQASAPKLSSVFYNSPAGRAGLDTGDLILKINGRTVLDRRDLMREISLLPPDSLARLTVWRPRKKDPFRVTVRLGKWPAQRDEEIIVTKPRYPQWRGLIVDYPTARNRFLRATSPYPDAVVIRDVLPGSVGEEAGLQSGEFIASVQGHSVTRPAEFYDTIRNAEGNVTLRLLDGRELSLPAPSSPTP